MRIHSVWAAATLLLTATHAHAQFVPATYQQPQPYCREFTNNVGVGGQVQQGYGQACRQPDGAWQIGGAHQAPVAQQVQYVQQYQQPYQPQVLIDPSPAPRSVYRLNINQYRGYDDNYGHGYGYSHGYGYHRGGHYGYNPPRHYGYGHGGHGRRCDRGRGYGYGHH